MKISWRYLLPCLVLAVLLVLAFLNPALVVACVIDPAARVFWWALRLLAMIDQQVYWILLIFAAFTLLVRFVPARPQVLPRPAYQDPGRMPDRVAYWHNLIQSASRDPAARKLLQQALQDLDRAVDQAAGINGAAAVSLPPAPSGPLAALRTQWRNSFLHRFPRYSANPADPHMEKQVGQILSSLETRLEILHDQSDSTVDGD